MAKPRRVDLRRQSRRLALQSIYQWEMAPDELGDIIHRTVKEMAEAPKHDDEYLQGLVRGVVAEHDLLDEEFEPLITRPKAEINPVELAVLRMAVFELKHRQDIPYRVVINEALEINKEFGTQEGYRFVNGVLDKLASKLRPMECKK